MNSMYTAILIDSLYHEIAHAKQCKIMYSERDSLRTKIFINNLFNYDINKTYNYSIELNARIIAYNQMMKLLRCRIKYVILPSKISLCVDDLFTYLFIEDLKDFYEEESPVEKMKIDLSEYDYQNYDNYERILLGLPLDEKAREKVLTLNTNNAPRLKKYINKY